MRATYNIVNGLLHNGCHTVAAPPFSAVAVLVAVWFAQFFKGRSAISGLKCAYRIVMVIDLWPSSFCTVLMSTPAITGRPANV